MVPPRRAPPQCALLGIRAHKKRNVRTNRISEDEKNMKKTRFEMRIDPSVKDQLERACEVHFAQTACKLSLAEFMTSSAIQKAESMGVLRVAKENANQQKFFD